jgi:long-chain acyl-CoA synthetase
LNARSQNIGPSRGFSPVRFLDLLPLSHMFGQAMAAFMPPMHAVLALEPGVNQNDVVRQANTRLEDHQKIRSTSVWTEDGLPRTEGTRKLKRRELKRWAETGGSPPERAQPSAQRTVATIVTELAHRDRVTAETTIDELGLISLEHIELMTVLEEQFDITIDEGEFSNARTVGDLESLAQRGAPTAPRRDKGTSVTAEARPEPVKARDTRGPEPMSFPTWNRRLPARAIRRINLPLWILPLARAFAWIQVRGRSSPPRRRTLATLLDPTT